MSKQSPTQSPQFLLQPVRRDFTGVLRDDYGIPVQVDKSSPATTVNVSATALINSSESDPMGIPVNTPGAKLDKGKVDVLRGAVQYFPRALKMIAQISEIGAKKYSWKGWEHVPNGQIRYGAAMMRHVLAEDIEEFDSDTGMPHIGQSAWNALARLELYIRENETKTSK